MIPDEAKQTILDALADLPSGPPPEEVLSVLLAHVWDEGYRECYERQMYEPVPVNPYKQ